MTSDKNKRAVVFLPSGKTEENPRGRDLLELAQQAGVKVPNTCNGVGTCGKCLVRVSGEVSDPTATEARFLSREQMHEGWRLACQCWPSGRVEVEVPEHGPGQILASGVFGQFHVQPIITKKAFALHEPSLEDQTGDYERACRALGLRPDVEPPIETLRMLSHSVRPDWSATAVTDGQRLLGIEPKDTSDRLCGAAFDIGTTTLVGYLHDLHTGDEIAVASSLNPQTAYGADVITRIEHVINAERGLRTMQFDLTREMNAMVGAMADSAGISRKDIYCVSVAGNSVMQHLFLGIDPRNIAFAPYIPVVQSGLTVSAASARLDINPAGRVLVMPAVASYVGGDIVADILATSLDRSRRRTLLVDIGTNGEIVLAAGGRVVACAAPAGPCFEGANISSGMQASDGAISAVALAGGDLEVRTIGGKAARGFCGSGLIDAVAALLDAGLVDDTGRLATPDDIPGEVGDALRARVRMRDGKSEVAVASGADGDVVLTQGDIRELQNAKSSIAAGIQVICSRMGLGWLELDRVLLAGAFGNFVNPASAVRIGLLPAVELSKIVPVGNAAGTGARMALLSKRERKRCEAIRRKVQYVELSGTTDFRDAYMDQMFFPEK